MVDIGSPFCDETVQIAEVHQARCSCGWSGDERETGSEAIKDGHAHIAVHIGVLPHSRQTTIVGNLGREG